MVIGTPTDFQKWAALEVPHAYDHFPLSVTVHGRSMMVSCDQHGNAKGQLLQPLL
jgi:hypothetical protein